MVTKSLSKRLISAFAFTTFLALAIMGGVISYLHSIGLKKQFDGRMEQTMRVLAKQITEFHAEQTSEAKQYSNPKNTLILDINGAPEPEFFVPLSGAYWQIYQIHTHDLVSVDKFELLDSSPSVGENLLSLEQLNNAQQTFMQSNTPALSLELSENNDTILRLLVRPLHIQEHDLSFMLIIARSINELEDEIHTFNLMLAAVLCIIGGLFILTQLVIFKAIWQPLPAVKEELNQIRSGQKARLSTLYPREILPLVEAINQLLAGNDKIIERSRTHVSNLAHGLKTPLSVLNNFTQTQLKGDTQQRMKIQIEMMRHQIEHHLQRARIGAGQGGFAQSSKLSDVLPPLIKVMRKLFPEKTWHQLTLDLDVEIALEKQDLQEILGNILENAGQYGGDEIWISAKIQAEEAVSHILLSIADNGKGLSEAQKQIVLKRGQRLDENTAGSGLGLAIVKEVITLYDGKLILKDRHMGGLEVCIHLPLLPKT